MNAEYAENSTGTAEAAFNRQAPVFDHLYGQNPIIQYERKRIREHALPLLKPGSKILELNAGTGEDSIFFAHEGHRVHATDISAEMLKMLRQKVQHSGLESNISTELCSFSDLKNLQEKGPYDMIFSNFGGLNCTSDLKSVLNSFDPLLKKGGTVVLVIMPPFSIWEFMLAFQGRFKTAFRRFNSKNGVTAHIEGINFTCWYYKPSYVIAAMQGRFDLVKTEALCAIVPPSFFEHFADKRPRVFSILKKWENRLKSTWLWKNMGDYYIISFRKK